MYPGGFLGSNSSGGGRVPSGKPSRSGKTSGPLLELLLSCIRSSFDSATAARIRELARQVTDWPRVSSLALAQGVLPLFFTQMQSACPHEIRAETCEGMRRSVERNGQRHTHLLNELLRLVDFFSARSIPVLAFGGPVLAETAYPSPDLRYASEPHLLVLGEALRRAEELLFSEGYRRIQYGPSEHQQYFHGPSTEQVFVRPDDQSGVVLRAGLVPRYFSVRLDAREVAERRVVVSIRGRDVPTLAPEDFLLVHCLDGTKYGWEHLGWLCDTAEFLGSHPQMDWTQLVQRARASGAGRALRLGLCLASDWLGAPLPPAVQQSLATDRVVQSAVIAVRTRLLQEKKDASNPLGSFWFHLRLQSGLLGGLRYALRAALTPTSGDWRFLQLPRPLFPLYYLLRPVRVAFQLGQRVFRRSVADLAPYLPSPMEVTLGMLALAEVRPDDVVYDIGCGDGRLVIEAARRYGARGVGVDLDSRLIAGARANARRAGVEDRVTLLEQDAESLDLSGATVVMLYLLPATNLRLRHRLQEQLRPGARVVSHRFDMGDWAPDRTEVLSLSHGATHTLYLWRI